MAIGFRVACAKLLELEPHQLQPRTACQRTRTNSYDDGFCFVIGMTLPHEDCMHSFVG